MVKKIGLLGLFIGLTMTVGCNQNNGIKVDAPSKEVKENVVNIAETVTNEDKTTKDNNKDIKSISIGLKDELLSVELVAFNDDGTLSYRLNMQDKDGNLYHVPVITDLKGNILNAYKELSRVEGFKYGKSIVEKDTLKDGETIPLHGILDASGKYTIEPKYTEINEHNGKFYTLIDSNSEEQILVNADGKEILKGDFEQLGMAFRSVNSHNIDFVYDKGKIYKDNGDVIETTLKNGDVCKFLDDYEIVQVESDNGTEYYAVDTNGKITKCPKDVKDFYPKYNAYWKTDESNAAYTKSSYYTNDKKVDALSNVNSYTDTTNGSMIVEDDNGQFMAVTPDGKVITKEKYAELSKFNSDGRAVAKKLPKVEGGKSLWVVIDKDGNEVLGEDANIVECGIDHKGYGTVINATKESEDGTLINGLLNINTMEFVDKYQLEAKLTENALK